MAGFKKEYELKKTEFQNLIAIEINRRDVANVPVNVGIEDARDDNEEAIVALIEDNEDAVDVGIKGALEMAMNVGIEEVEMAIVALIEDNEGAVDMAIDEDAVDVGIEGAVDVGIEGAVDVFEDVENADEIEADLFNVFGI